MSSQRADEKGRGAEMGLWVLVDAFADPELKYTLVGPTNLGEVPTARGTAATKFHPDDGDPDRVSATSGHGTIPGKSYAKGPRKTPFYRAPGVLFKDGPSELRA